MNQITHFFLEGESPTLMKKLSNTKATFKKSVTCNTRDAFPAAKVC